MNSFNALQIEIPDGQFVRGFVQMDQSGLDFRNATECVVCALVVEAGGA
jgi:hypothetical protein